MSEIPPPYGSDTRKQFARIFEATGCRTQAELAALLGIKQASVSGAKKHGRIPEKWLASLLRLGINPDWIMTGDGPRFVSVIATGAEGGRETPLPLVEALAVLDRAVLRNILACFPSQTLHEELNRRREICRR